MTTDNSSLTAEDSWHSLKQFTSARIALGRAGFSLPTKANLDFQLAHALARDAVNIPLDFGKLEQALNALGYKTLPLQTQAESHQIYLQRPDKGRLLNLASMESIQCATQQIEPPDIVVIVADGLSSNAIEKHAVQFLELLFPRLRRFGYLLSPIALVKYGRVAIGDPVAELFSARMCIVLIGERPGLSSPDSMGIYFTYQAKTGSTDADRNCISNIHKNGLSYGQALEKLLFLVSESDRLQFSGVHLKDETSHTSLDKRNKPTNFLLD
ncbi:MAG: ethanolamine ammonia-lyase subunit EutC [Methylobacter sp.]|nr:ethanolamine ammonia-lyase subunit EutC [Methylobacter sp.]